MIRMLLKFWPVFIPVILYIIWYVWSIRRAKKNGDTVPRFLSGAWWWVVIATLVIGIAMFVIWGLSMPETKGNYEPAHMENGKLIPGRVNP